MKTVFLFLISTFAFCAFSQNTTDVFQRISIEMKNYSVDTGEVPNDSLSDAIRTLRNTKGGFNIAEAIEYKIAEDLNKGGIMKESADKITDFFSTGNGKRWLENAVIWIYRKQFTLEEVKELVLFYQSSAGKKMAANFPVIMLQSMRAAEQITEQFKNSNKE
jgi:hypothetical protein